MPSAAGMVATDVWTFVTNIGVDLQILNGDLGDNTFALIVMAVVFVGVFGVTLAFK